jgi:PrtD family type I secretion system ABC transporter
MKVRAQHSGDLELRAAWNQNCRPYWIVGLFSLFSNLMMLTGPIYMLQVYDRVLGSKSQETLVALSLLVVLLYGVMGVLDWSRGRIMTRVGARFQNALDEQVFAAVLQRSAKGADFHSQTGLRNIEAIRRFMAAPVFLACFDLPWAPIFLIGIFILHPMLGWLAVAGALVLVTLTCLNQWFMHQSQSAAGVLRFQAGEIADQMRDEAEMICAMGMQEIVRQRWLKERKGALDHQTRTSDVTGGFSSLTKTLRLFLQSAMLGLGAYLVLENQMTAGGIIAGSILLGRALVPVETILNQWEVIQSAKAGWDGVGVLLSGAPVAPRRIELPCPNADLEARSLTVVRSGEKIAALRNVTFQVQPGQAIGVIGPSGSGKSTLAQAITGALQPVGGSLRLDAAALDQYDPTRLGEYVGYLPQRVRLFDGTISENIARLDPEMEIRAAKSAAAHEMILELPDGYETRLRSAQSRLSGGQMQRIGLARAMCGEPPIVVLDEPNSNLDAIGTDALNAAIRTIKLRKGAVIVMAHRPAAIRECDLLLVLENGTPTAFGPRDEVLRKTVQNHHKMLLASNDPKSTP